MKAPTLFLLVPAVMFFHGGLLAGPYSAGLNDPANTRDAPVPGFVGPDGEGGARIDDGFGGLLHPRNFVNPLFFGWAAEVADYAPASGVSAGFADETLSLGPVTGDNFDIVSLGDLSAAQISGGALPGSITLHFANPIRNLTGADFTVFENALSAAGGGIFGELGYVEASSDGVNFVRFPAASLTPAAVGAYGTLDPTNLFNLVGKHVNADGQSWGTPFDLAAVGLSSASYIRIVDIPGSGAFRDSANRPIYDAWLTFGSGGVDLEAVGAISTAITFEQWQTVRGLAGAQRGAAVDVEKDGVPNLLEYAFARLPDRVDASAPPTTTEIAAGRLVVTFTRDERATDLRYEVQGSHNPAANDWTTIAQSNAGLAMLGANGHAPAITETSASTIASIGVLRKVRIVDDETVAGNSRRFLRIKVTTIPVP